MSKLLGLLLVLIAAIIVGGAIYLAVWDVPPPAHKVEKALADEVLRH